MGAPLASKRAPRRTRAGKAPAGRRARKKSRTRREIFEAAMALFEAQGFEAVTVEQICQAADVARGTFFLHFPTKSALLFEWNRELASELSLRLAEPRGSAVAEYRMLVDHVGQRWLRHADVMGAMLRDFLATPGAAAAAPGEDALRALVEEIVRRGQERGEFRRNVSPRLAAMLLLTTAAAVLAGAVFREGEASPEEIRNQLLHAVLHGLVQPKPRLKWQPGGDVAPRARP
jgi:AcrR family transcriptional regulator